MASLRSTKDVLLETDVPSIQEDCKNDDKELSVTQKPKPVRDGQYSDPVYKKLSLINGEINKLTKEQLKEKCAELRLDTRGMKDVLKKRLKNYYKRKKLMKARVHPPEGSKTPYDYLLVIDFEATCEANVDDYCHEIIEFPGILVDVQQNKIVDEFHSYCRPMLNPDLTKFCSDLTGISQEQVNKADTFPEVLKAAEKWMESQSLGKDRSFVVVTDGPWDMSRFLYGQCVLSDLSFPRWGRQWVNVRKSYSNFYQCRRTKITNMLENLGMTFEGNLHSGRDDARNISQICIRMMEDGCILRPNEELKLSLPGEPRAFSSEVTTLSDKEESADYQMDRSMRKSASEGIVPAFKSLNLNSTSESDEQENLDDLMQYYKLQKT